jgi:thiamine-monophosphate kinase
VAAGRALASEHLIHAMMDISDGLGGDLPHVCSASGVGALVFERLLPIAPAAYEFAAESGTSPEALALGGGEDYELLVALPQETFERAREAVGDINLTRIGDVVEASDGIVVEGVDGKRRPLEEAGWRHF